MCHKSIMANANEDALPGPAHSTHCNHSLNRAAWSILHKEALPIVSGHGDDFEQSIFSTKVMELRRTFRPAANGNANTLQQLTLISDALEYFYGINNFERGDNRNTMCRLDPRNDVFFDHEMHSFILQIVCT